MNYPVLRTSASRRAGYALVLSALAAAAWSLLLQCGCRDAPEAVFPPRTTPLVIDVTGHKYQWRVVHPGRDDRHGTVDDVAESRNVHVPADTPILLRLASRDLLYTLSLPAWNLKQIAVPDLTFTMEFESGRSGTSGLRGDQLCGFSHESLIGELIVLSRGDYDAWLERGSISALPDQESGR